MNDMEPFERRLKRQPLRQTPAGWREEILSAAREAQQKRQRTAALQNASVAGKASVYRWLLSCLWPHPVAWGGLAAIWVFIFAANFSMQDKTSMVAEKVTPPSPEVIAELRQQQRMLAELIGPNIPNDADRPKIIGPAPRSERVNILAA